MTGISKPKLLPTAAYLLGTLTMAFGWLCALAQGDAPQGSPKIGGMVIIFATALGLLVAAAVGMRRGNRLVKYLMLPMIGIQAVLCVYAVVAEFAL